MEKEESGVQTSLGMALSFLPQFPHFLSRKMLVLHSWWEKPVTSMQPKLNKVLACIATRLYLHMCVRVCTHVCRLIKVTG